MKPRPTANALRTLCIGFVLTLVGCSQDASPRSAAAEDATGQIDGLRTARDAFHLATRLGKSGRYEEAVRAYSRAIAMDPGYRDAYTFRAFTYVQLGNFGAAIEDLDSLVVLDPSADSYRSRADVYARYGHLDEAIADYDRSVELDPTDASAYRNRASAFGEKRDYSKALLDIAQAIRLEPKEKRWRLDRAILRAKQGDYAGAMVDAEEALRLAGGVPYLRPGESRITDEFTFTCLRLIADLEKAGAKRAQR